MRRSIVVDVNVRFVTYSALLLSLYLLAAGHNQPGGGFIGGLVAGAALGLAYVAGGLEQVRSTVRLRPWVVLGGGLLVVTAAALLPMLLGGPVLEQGFVTLDLPVLGTPKLTSALAFDTGVYLVVVGTVLMAFEALGEDTAPEQESAPTEVVDR
jgi:multisubunit Na+/H+ antiporter MnhB subunit